MPFRSNASCAALAVLIAGPVAVANEVIVESHVGDGWDEHGYAGLTTWRVYAVHCDAPPHNYEEDILSVFGLRDRALSMRSSDGFFHNAKIDSLSPPEDLTGAGIWENLWDTFVTLDREVADPTWGFGLSPGFAEVTNNLSTSFVSTNIGWFATPDDCGSCLPLCEDGRVLIAQVSVAECETISGTVSWLTREGLEYSSISFSSRPPGHCPEACPEDLDEDGVVNWPDVLAVLAAWGPCASCPEDLDGTGTVDFADLLAVLSAWGACRGA